MPQNDQLRKWKFIEKGLTTKLTYRNSQKQRTALTGQEERASELTKQQQSKALTQQENFKKSKLVLALPHQASTNVESV